MTSLKTAAALAAILLGLLGAAAAGDESAKAAAAKKIASLKWLAGDWSGPMWDGEFVAYYSTPEGGRVLSTSELRKGGTVAFHEFERFEVRDVAGAPTVVLTPYPGGQPAASFTLAALDEKERKATFENPKKDFPTRIVYHRASEDRLVITLSDPEQKRQEEEVFDLKRRK